jgi:hypothetical protein
VQCGAGEQPTLANYTSAVTPSAVNNTFGQDVYYSDGLPIEFSWPILPSTLDATDFAVHLNDGSTIAPKVASIWPNFEYNERSVAVIFGHFGNRIAPTKPGAIYPVSVAGRYEGRIPPSRAFPGLTAAIVPTGQPRAVA